MSNEGTRNMNSSRVNSNSNRKVSLSTHQISKQCLGSLPCSVGGDVERQVISNTIEGSENHPSRFGEQLGSSSKLNVDSP